MKKTFLLFTILFLSINTYSQKKKFKKNEDKIDYLYTNEWSLGFRFLNNGFGANFERAWFINIWRRHLLQVNFFYYRDFRQQKSKTIYNQAFNALPFFYGKQHNFFSFNVLYGQRKVIGEKADKKGVRVSIAYLGGVSLGLLKPYGLLINKNKDLFDPQTEIIYYSEENHDTFLGLDASNGDIYGAGGIRYGFNKIKPIPSLHGKFGFTFDWATREVMVKAVEVGIQLDVFYKKLPILVNQTNKPYIFSIYLGLNLGGRW